MDEMGIIERIRKKNRGRTWEDEKEKNERKEK